MADFPTSVYSPRTKANKAGVVYDANKTTIGYAEDITKLDAEVVALETYLGLPAGQAGKYVKVNAGEDGFEFTDPPAGGFSSRARAYRNATQSIPNNTNTKVDFNAETWDGLGEFANGRFTAQVAGYYLVTSMIKWATFSGNVIMTIRKGGAEHAELYFKQDTNLYSTVVSDIVYLAVGNYIEIFLFQDSGSSQNIFLGASKTFVSIHRLS